MSETTYSAKLVVLCLNYFLLSHLITSEFRSQSLAQKFPESEVLALKIIANKLDLFPEGTAPADFRNSAFCDYRNSTHTTYKSAIQCNCSFEEGTVCHFTSISLSGRYLNAIPEELANLTLLFMLDLSNNRLTGSIPSSLGNFTQLTCLRLRSNFLTGNIPLSFGQLTNLKYLDLSNNRLTGSIPPSLGNFTQLTHLRLQSNFLIDNIPSSFGQLTNLKYLSMDDNGLSGPLPPELGNLKNLFGFSVRSNNINGTLPASYANVTFGKSLQQFSVSGNYMAGPIPDFIANWNSMNFLSFYGNNFRGSIPSGIFSMSSLKTLMISDVADSHFQFPVHANLANIHSLILRNCSITGPIPTYIGNMPSLAYLDLSFNTLTGGIPDSLRKLNLTYMSFAQNMLNGTIPDWITTANQTKMMDLSYNNFSKLAFAVPSSSKLKLNLFACCCNSSTSCAPNTINPNQIMENRCPGRKNISNSLFINCGGQEIKIGGHTYENDTDRRQFYASPKGTWAYTSSGSFLSVVSNSTNISTPDAPLYEQARSCPVSLKYYGFCLRPGKYNVALHFAEISYSEDQTYNTSKRVFDMYIQGEKKLTDFNIKEMARGVNKVYIQNLTAHVTHDRVLEIHLYWAGKGSSPDGHNLFYEGNSMPNLSTLTGPLISAISVTPAFDLDGGKLSTLHITLISVASATVFGLFILAFTWMMGLIENDDRLQEINIGIGELVTLKQLEDATDNFSERREIGFWTGTEINIGIGEHVTLKQLEDATDNFSERREIGQGGFGTIYKAELQDHVVAVKRLNSPSDAKILEMKNEFYALKSLSHENLVQLLDVYHGNDMHLLIYEYMPNNSLAHALFDSNSKLKLAWEQRYTICLGVARGLMYLHENPRLKMVHRDIKAANILLDEQIKAKISNLGLASLYNEDDQVKFIREEVPQGYMAPEYVQGFVTYKADVYSFGVVMLEVVSGRKNAEHKGQGSELLLDTAFDLHRKGRLMDLVDKNLGGKYNAKRAIIMLNLAMKCTSISPSLRPTMSEVVSVLVGEKRIEDICVLPSNDASPPQLASSIPIDEVTSKATTSSNFINAADEAEDNIFEE